MFLDSLRISRPVSKILALEHQPGALQQGGYLLPASVGLSDHVAQGFLAALPIGHVNAEPGDRDGLALGVVDHGERELVRYPPAVPSHHVGLHPLGLTAVEDRVQRSADALRIIVGEQVGDRHRLDLVVGVTGDFFESFVPEVASAIRADEDEQLPEHVDRVDGE